MSTLKSKVISAPINGATVESLVLQTNNTDRVTIDGSGGINISNGQIIKDSSGNVGLGMTPDGTALLQIAGGTTSTAPIELTSGSIMTTPDAGSIEYDGKAFYATPQGTQRGIVPSEMYFRLNANRAGSNATGVQSVFGVGATLSAGTMYEFELVYSLNKPSGATSHTISTLFGGTATFNNIFVSGVYNSGAAAANPPAGGSANVGVWLQATAIVMTSTITAATNTFSVRLTGTVSVNAGGTFIPQYSLSAAPGGAYSTLAGSYFKIKPIGAAGADINVGGFA